MAKSDCVESFKFILNSSSDVATRLFWPKNKMVIGRSHIPFPDIVEITVRSWDTVPAENIPEASPMPWTLQIDSQGNRYFNGSLLPDEEVEILITDFT